MSRNARAILVAFPGSLVSPVSGEVQVSAICSAISAIDPSLPCGWGTGRKSMDVPLQAFDCSNLRRVSVSLALKPLIYFMLAPVNFACNRRVRRAVGVDAPAMVASIWRPLFGRTRKIKGWPSPFLGCAIEEARDEAERGDSQPGG